MVYISCYAFVVLGIKTFCPKTIIVQNHDKEKPFSPLGWNNRVKRDNTHMTDNTEFQYLFFTK